MTDDDVDVDDGDFDDTLDEIPGDSFMATPSFDLDLAFGAIDSNVDFDRTHLLSSISPCHHLCSFFCCYWGAYLSSGNFHYHNHL